MISGVREEAAATLQQCEDAHHFELPSQDTSEVQTTTGGFFKET
jgi:hypothetical protein